MIVAPGAAVALVVCGVVFTTLGPWGDVRALFPDAFTVPVTSSRGGDLYLYGSIADLILDGRVPYHDFALEYPPLALIPMVLARLLDGPAGFDAAFGLLMLPCLLVVQQGAARLAGDERSATTVAWLVALSPLLVGALLRTRFDLLPVAILVVALLALARGRPTVAFVLLGLGTMAKLFPALLVPLVAAWLAGRGERRAALRGVGAFVATVVLIAVPFAGDGFVDQFRFHLERPVQIESTPASVLFAAGGSGVTGYPVRADRFRSNGLDGGLADPVATGFALLLGAVLAGLVLVASRRGDVRHLVLCAFAALLAFVSLGKVLSPQFVIWLVPFAALAWAWGQRLPAALVAVAMVLTLVEFPYLYFDLVARDGGAIGLVAARNVLLLGALTVLTARLAAAPARSPRLAVALRSG